MFSTKWPADAGSLSILRQEPFWRRESDGPIRRMACHARLNRHGLRCRQRICQLRCQQAVDMPCGVIRQRNAPQASVWCDGIRLPWSCDRAGVPVRGFGWRSSKGCWQPAGGAATAGGGVQARWWRWRKRQVMRFMLTFPDPKLPSRTTSPLSGGPIQAAVGNRQQRSDH